MKDIRSLSKPKHCSEPRFGFETLIAKQKQQYTTIRNCLTCQVNTPAAQTEPLKMSVLPESAWHSVSADFYGPLPTGEYLLVIIDNYTRYSVVESVRATSANTVLPVMNKVFSMFGIPRVVKNDNGPPFNSDEFSQFADYLGFHHCRITPLWP